MFTFADIRNIAIQIEENGEATYRRAADRVADPEIARLLRNLAEEERKHGEVFAAMQASGPLTADQAELEAMGRALLQDIVRNQTFSLAQEELGAARTIDALLGQSIGFEEDTIQFYQFLAGFVDEAEAVGQLEAIIAQEQGHVAQLEQMRKGLAAASADSEEIGAIRR